MTKLIVLAVRAYQALARPFLPPACRFEPSCSNYALGAVERFGGARGLLLTLARLSKCHPFHPGGLDPIPH
jgi:putative membrane protein insertion efficiency factor